MPDATAILAKWKAICKAATNGYGYGLVPRLDAEFHAAARTGWPATIRALEVAVHGLSRISGESNDETMGLVADDSLAEIQAILEGRDA